MSEPTLADNLRSAGWQPLDTLPNNVVDVLARYYDAGLNCFLIQRFCGCVVNDDRVFWASPFPGDKHTVDLAKNGYRVILWRHIPELPEDIRAPLAGPDDRAIQSAELAP